MSPEKWMFNRPPVASIFSTNFVWRRLLGRRRGLAALGRSKTDLAAWIIPLLYAGGAIVCGFTVPRLAYSVLPGLVSTISVNAAIGIYSAVASGMLALTSIVFSLTFLMVQFSATAYSPRLVVWIARDRVISHATGVFTATFLFAL